MRATIQPSHPLKSPFLESVRQTIRRRHNPNRDPAAVLATAILDRLLHQSTTVNIKGDSYRLKEKRRAGLLGRAPQPPAELLEREDAMP